MQQQQIDATLADFQAIQEAAEAVEAPFQLATCGWVLGPPQSPALFDGVLPKSWPLSCINRNVGHDPVEPGFANITGRPQWAIPWLEDDPAMIIPQLWVGRMRKDAADALRYGCDGLLGIHWRTRILGPNVAALAQASWSQEAWKTGDVDRNPPALEGSFEDRRWSIRPGVRPPATTSTSIGRLSSSDGGRVRGLDRSLPVSIVLCHVPRIGSTGQGGLLPIRDPGSGAEEYEFVDQLRDLRPLVQGPGNRERFDYWLNNFRYLRAVGKLNLHVGGTERGVGVDEADRGCLRAEAAGRTKGACRCVFV